MKLYLKEMSVSSKNKILIVVFVLMTVQALAQTVPPLERVVTIEFTGEKAEDALSKLSKEAKITFSYNPSILDAKQHVNESFKSKTVREILEQLFKGAITYKEKGKYIILTKAPVRSSIKTTSGSTVMPLFMYGYILNAATGDKLSEVSVYDKKSLTAAVSNQFGYFKLEIEQPERENKIAISKRNFIDTTLVITENNDGYLTIQLSPEHQNIPVPVSIPDSSVQPIDTVKQSVNPEIPDSVEVLEEKPVSSIGMINAKNIRDTLYKNFQASVWPFVGTNRKLSGNVINGYSFNLIGGYSLGTKYLEIGGVFNIDRGNVSNVQIAGLFNTNGGRMRSFQVAGLFNANKGGLKGAQFSGLANINIDSVKGAQFAGVANVNAGAGGGAQFAGLVNVATRKLKGTQVALVNYGKNVKGAQIGFLNIADTLQGVPIGVFSYASKGYHKLEFFADEIFYTNLAFRTGTHKFYNILTFGVKPESDEEDSSTEWTFGYGFGFAPKLTRWLFLNFDITSNQYSKGKFTEAINLINKVYAGLEVQPARKFSIAFGITLNGYLTKNSYDGYTDIFNEEYRPEIIKEHNYNNGTNLKMWWGAKAAIRFF